MATQNNDEATAKTMFRRISHWGYEIEYPIACRSTWSSTIGSKICRKYNLHEDGGGIEFTTSPAGGSDPVCKSLPSMKQRVRTIYQLVAGVPTRTDFDLFNSSFAGVHIRIDVTDWSEEERLRYCTLLSGDMDMYLDYTSFVSSVVGRGWISYNYPAEMKDIRAIIDRHAEDKGHYACSSGKIRNVKYEIFRYGDAITLENRMFGVCRTVEEALKQFDVIKLLCRIVAVSFAFNGSTIANDLYNAYRKVVTKQSVPISDSQLHYALSSCLDANLEVIMNRLSSLQASADSVTDNGIASYRVYIDCGGYIPYAEQLQQEIGKVAGSLGMTLDARDADSSLGRIKDLCSPNDICDQVVFLDLSSAKERYLRLNASSGHPFHTFPPRYRQTPYAYTDADVNYNGVIHMDLLDLIQKPLASASDVKAYEATYAHLKAC